MDRMIGGQIDRLMDIQVDTGQIDGQIDRKIDDGQIDDGQIDRFIDTDKELYIFVALNIISVQVDKDRRR